MIDNQRFHDIREHGQQQNVSFRGGNPLLMFNYEVRCDFWQLDIKIVCRHKSHSTNLFDRTLNICRSTTHEHLFDRQTTRINVKPHRLLKVISHELLLLRLRLRLVRFDVRPFTLYLNIVKA